MITLLTVGSIIPAGHARRNWGLKVARPCSHVSQRESSPGKGGAAGEEGNSSDRQVVNEGTPEGLRGLRSEIQREGGDIAGCGAEAGATPERDHGSGQGARILGPAHQLSSHQTGCPSSRALFRSGSYRG